MTYEIIKNEPLPGNGRAWKPRYPFAEMVIGDSFCIPPRADKTHTQLQNYVTSSVNYYRKRYAPGTRFTTRVRDGAVWVWRTA